MKSIRLGLVTGLLVLGGCASGPGYQEYAAQIPSISEEQGRIYFYRIATMGAAVQPKIRVNGEPVGAAKPKGFFYIDRAPGEYTVAATTEAKRSLSLVLEPGSAKYVRLEMKMGLFAGHVKPVLVDNSVGEAEIQKTKYTGATQ